MVADIHELRGLHQQTLDEMQAIVDTAETDDRDLSDQEQSDYDELRQTADKYERRIGRLASLREQRDNAPMPAQPEVRSQPEVQARDYDQQDFRSLGEFLNSVRYNTGDQRLRGLAAEQRQTDQAMGSGLHDATGGPLGGFAVPEQFREELLEVAQQNAIIRPRAFTIPAGSPPDAPIYMPSLDQTSTSNRYGGVEVTWIDEAATKPQTEANLLQVELEPNEVAGHITASDKLLRNWSASEAVFRRLLAGAVTSSTETAYMTGSGTGQPQGIVGSGAAHTVNRATASEVAYADVAEMYARLLMGGSPVWIASQSILPEILTMEDTAGNLIFQPGAREGVMPQLLGFPILWNERSPALGTAGDLVLADLQYYLIKDGSGPFVAASEHVHFTTNQTVIKIFFNIDGKPWLTEPVLLENSYEVSPFVVLGDPAA